MGAGVCRMCGDMAIRRSGKSRGLCATHERGARLERKRRQRATPEGRVAYRAKKREESRLRSRRVAEREGRPYIPRGERKPRPIDPCKAPLRDLRAMARNKLKVWIKLLVVADPSYEKAKPSAVEYAARYRFDPVFRAGAISRRAIRRARTRAADDGTLTPTALAGLMWRAKRCCYCRQPMRPEDKTLEHVIPLSRGGAHSIHNADVACRKCNFSKHARTVDEWGVSRCAA